MSGKRRREPARRASVVATRLAAAEIEVGEVLAAGGDADAWVVEQLRSSAPGFVEWLAERGVIDDALVADLMVLAGEAALTGALGDGWQGACERAGLSVGDADALAAMVTHGARSLAAADWADDDEQRGRVG